MEMPCKVQKVNWNKCVTKSYQNKFFFLTWVPKYMEKSMGASHTTQTYDLSLNLSSCSEPS